MSENNYNSDLDAILAEFASYSSQFSGEAPEKKTSQPQPEVSPRPQRGEEPAQRAVRKYERVPSYEPQGDKDGQKRESGSYYVDVSMLTDYLETRRDREQDTRPVEKPAAAKKPAAGTKATKPRRDEGRAAAARERIPQPAPAEKAAEEFTPDFKPSGREYSRPVPMTKKAPAKRKPPVEPDVDRVLSASDREKAQKIRRQAEDKEAARQAQRSALSEKRKLEDWESEQLMEQRQHSDRPLMTLVAVLFVFLSLLSFGWVAKNVHPDSGTGTAATVLSKLDLPHNLDVYLNNAYADALSDVTYIKKIYTIPESASSGPRPNPAAFGETTDPAVIQAVIEDAALLLDGQKTLWSPDINFYPGTTMQYYRDDSILVITWKEVYDERCCTMAEVKIAHGSQFRRRLAEDSYGSSVQFYASEMAKASNAVVASNADFYAFRTYGVTVYQRQLFRAEPGKLDTCFITSSGDMLFTRAGELTEPAQMEKYVRDNDVLFSLSFGPVLVDNGQLQYCQSYPIGEIDTQYSRAGLGLLDELHYLLMTVNHTDGRPRANVNQFGQYMYEKGCIKAYNMDGGQTSEIVMNGKPVNYIDFNAERTVSDIIYFASAIPEAEWAQTAQTEVTQ